MDNIALLMVTYFIVATVLLTVALTLMSKFKKDKYRKQLENLEKEKNLLGSVPIPQELSRVETILKNDELNEKFKEWNNRYKLIKEKGIPKINDMILEADFLIEQKDYNNLVYKIVKTELEIFKVNEKANSLLDQIKEVTLSEEKNREVITKLKSKFRELNHIYKDKKEEYGTVSNSIELQFENIEKRFLEFEKNMEGNNYVEVGHIIKALDEMLDHMQVVIDEIPNIILMSNTLIPRKIEEVTDEYTKMLRQNYPLEYLNFDYNVSETRKKLSDINARIKVLNLEDVLLELNTIFEYFDSLFNDFEDEKINRKTYQDDIRAFKLRLKEENNIMKEIYDQLEDIKYNYDLNDSKVEELDNLNSDLLSVNIDYKELLRKTDEDNLPYSELSGELDSLSNRLKKIDDELEHYLNNIGSMKEDEARAREQLEEIKTLLHDAKVRVRKNKLPFIPKTFYVELKEASLAVDYINRELEKVPISIKTLNTRVDTARDLAFKLFNTTTDTIKAAMMSEKAIVYGNRYRSSNPNVEHGLNNAEVLFFKGEYKKALETSINAIDLIEPGIYQRILRSVKN